jgi:D-beta-D-heptose 7-phosphate kinase/D-beta-D-heptose 1-phosphate adenosyltransferase
LNYARSLGDYLLVVIDSDRRVKELKGHLRPINPQEDRITLLENLRAVDMVQTFDSDNELISIIKSYQPDIMVKGSDYRDRPIIGSEYCKEIKFYERIEKYSTTGTIQDIINRG